MTLTREQLLTIMPNAKKRADLFLDMLNAAMEEFEINTPQRQAAFLAQIAHESGELRYVREIASGEAYEWRADLGNTELGDGARYRGRGLIQITGRAGYTACEAALGLDLIEHPELLEQPVNACRSAAWWWKAHGCNEIADSGDFKRLTRKINGGLNGLEDRQRYYAKAGRALGTA